MAKAYIFDMDGTMVDNMMVHHRAWQRKLAEYGLELTLEQVKEQIHGINEEIIARLFGDRFSPEQCRQISWEKEAAYRDIFLPELRLINGLDQFLQSAFLQGIPMGIGSAAPPENVDFVLDNLQLRPFFRAVVHSQMVSKGKPDPEVFLKVAEQLQVAPADCLLFEDSPTGVEAGRRAGMPTVVVATTHAPEEFAGFENVVRIVSDFRGM
jgi:beta-phosphoglucomutase family hydrolase